MKPLIVILILGSLALFSCRKSEEAATPDVVKQAFTDKFSKAGSAHWSMEAEGEYEVEFKLNGQNMSASFDGAGNWLETETEIAAADLPDAVRRAVADQFPGYSVDEAERTETAEGLTYELELKKEDAEIEVVLSPDGRVLKQERDEEEEEEN